VGESICDGILCLVEPVINAIFDISQILDGGFLQNSGFVLAIGGQGQFFNHLLDAAL